MSGKILDDQRNDSGVIRLGLLATLRNLSQVRCTCRDLGGMLSLMDLEPGWKALADAVQKRRARLGITQEEVAALGGPSTATVRSIETAGGSSFRAKTLFALDEALGWSRGTAQEIVEGPESFFGSFEDFVAMVVRHVSDADKRSRDYPVGPDVAHPLEDSRPPPEGEASRLIRSARDQLDQALRLIEGEHDASQEQGSQEAGPVHGGEEPGAPIDGPETPLERAAQARVDAILSGKRVKPKPDRGNSRRASGGS